LQALLGARAHSPRLGGPRAERDDDERDGSEQPDDGDRGCQLDPPEREAHSSQTSPAPDGSGRHFRR